MVAGLLVGVILVKETVLLAVITPFIMGGEISFGWGSLISYHISGVVGLVLAPVPPSITLPNQTHMETPIAQVMTIAQMSMRTGFIFNFFFHPKTHL